MTLGKLQNNWSHSKKACFLRSQLEVLSKLSVRLKLLLCVVEERGDKTEQGCFNT